VKEADDVICNLSRHRANLRLGRRPSHATPRRTNDASGDLEERGRQRFVAASDLGHHLEVRHPVPQWNRSEDRSAIGTRLAVIGPEMHHVALEPDHAPHHATASDVRAGRDRALHGAVFNVAVGKAKGEDRRRLQCSSLLRWRQLVIVQVRRLLHELHENRFAVGGPLHVADRPQDAFAAQVLAHRRGCSFTDAELIVAIWEADEVAWCRRTKKVSTLSSAKRVSPRRLHKALPNTPLVLGEKHAAQLRKPVRRVIEHSQDRFAVGDRERDEITPRVQRVKERIA